MVAVIWIVLFDIVKLDQMTTKLSYTPKRLRYLWRAETYVKSWMRTASSQLTATTTWLGSTTGSHHKPFYAGLGSYYARMTQQVSTWTDRRTNERERQHLIQLARCHQRDHYRPPRRRRVISHTIFAMLVVAQAKQGMAEPPSRRMTNIFDTDSGQVGIDSRCSSTISHKKEDFGNSLRPCNKVVTGFGGNTVSNVMTGTIKWRIEDDSGRVHSVHIPNSYYVPDGGVRLMSPQHWSQVHPHKGSVTCLNNHKEATLTWSRTGYTKTVAIDPAINVFTFNLAPGYQAYQAFITEAGDIERADELICFDSKLVSDDESSYVERADDDDPSLTHISEPTRLKRISYAVFCLKKKKQ